MPFFLLLFFSSRSFPSCFVWSFTLLLSPLFFIHESVSMSAREKLARIHKSMNRQVHRAFLFHGGPRMESWVQCLLDESFPSTSPRNHHHFSQRSFLSPPHVFSSPPLSSSYLFCPIPISFWITSSRTDYFLKDLCAKKMWISNRKEHWNNLDNNATQVYIRKSWCRDTTYGN